jgi:GWxTD domain-containing protein
MLLVGLALGVTSAQAFDPVRSATRPRFLLDVVTLPEPPDSVALSIRWEVPYTELAFHASDGFERARYEITVVMLERDQQVAGGVWERRVRARTLAETRDPDKTSRGRAEIRLRRGRYRMHATATDLVSHDTSEIFTGLDISAPARLGLSDLRFVRTTGGEILPNLSRDVPVGESGHAVELTLDPARGTETLHVAWRFSNSHKRELAAGDTTVSLGKGPVRLAIPVPAERMSPGLQRLEVRVENRDSGVSERRKAEFQARVTADWFVLNREEALEVFEAIAEIEELESLQKAGPEEWASRVEAFWSGRDPSSSTPENEYRDAIEARIELAAAMIAEPFQNPWKTDRGRVLLEHGRPDRRTAREAGFDTPASEVWEYDSPPRVFIFVDIRGSGEFSLQG